MLWRVFAGSRGGQPPTTDSGHELKNTIERSFSAVRKIEGGYIVTDDEMEARDMQHTKEMHKDLILRLHKYNLSFQMIQAFTGIPRSAYEAYCKELGIAPRD